jgi:hypothetical protein
LYQPKLLINLYEYEFCNFAVVLTKRCNACLKQ